MMQKTSIFLLYLGDRLFVDVGTVLVVLGNNTFIFDENTIFFPVPHTEKKSGFLFQRKNGFAGK